MFGFSPLTIILIITIIVAIMFARRKRKSKNNYKSKSNSFFSPSGEPNKVDEYLAFGGPFRSMNPNYLLWKELKKANELKEKELNQNRERHD